MNRISAALTILATLAAIPATASQWKTPPGTALTGSLFSADRATCREFAHYATSTWSSTPEGFVVMKDGEIQFEYYDRAYGPDRPHALWSVSKTITGALLGTAVRDGKVSLDQRLSEFYPLKNSTPAYEGNRLSNLFYADTGFVWDESTLEVTQNEVLKSLFAQLRVDIANYVVRRPVIEQGAGYRWQYNTGTPVVAMGALRKAYGSEYDELPWKNLFGPLGMKSAVFEQDTSGNFVGGGYAYATPRDMIKLGQLYLQKGKWDGKTILPESWINQTLTISPGFLSSGTTRERIIKGLHLVPGGLMWLNLHPRPDLPKPFPKSPNDAFMALGRSGQFIIVVPSHNMVLARTGRGGSIDDRIDGIVTRAIACLSDPGQPLADSPPAPIHKASSPSLKKTYGILKDGMRSGLVQGAVAKWVCSCHFVSKLSVDACLKRGDVPYSKQLMRIRVSERSVTADPNNATRLATGAKVARVAVYDPTKPHLGCWLLP